MKTNTIPPEHYALVERVARRVAHRTRGAVAVEDLVQEGILGYLDAVNRLDTTHAGASANAFLQIRIYGAMLDFLRRVDPLSQRRRRLKKKLDRIATEITRRTGEEAQLADIASEAGISIEAVSDVLMPIQYVAVDDLDCLVAEPADHTDNSSRLLDRYAALAKLSESDHVILTLTRAGYQQKEIAGRFKVSQARISQRLQEIVGTLARAARRAEQPEILSYQPVTGLPAKADPREVLMMPAPTNDQHRQEKEFSGKFDRCRQVFGRDWFTPSDLTRLHIFTNEESAEQFLTWLRKKHDDKVVREGTAAGRRYRFKTRQELTIAQHARTDAPAAPAASPSSASVAAPRESNHAEGETIIERLYRKLDGNSFRIGNVEHESVDAKNRNTLLTAVYTAVRQGLLSNDKNDKQKRNRLYLWTEAAHKSWGGAQEKTVVVAPAVKETRTEQPVEAPPPAPSSTKEAEHPTLLARMAALEDLVRQQAQTIADLRHDLDDQHQAFISYVAAGLAAPLRHMSTSMQHDIVAELTRQLKSTHST